MWFTYVGELFSGCEDVFHLQRVTLVDLDDQVGLNQQVVRALQIPVQEQPFSNLRQGLDFSLARVAWRDLILNNQATPLATSSMSAS